MGIRCQIISINGGCLPFGYRSSCFSSPNHARFYVDIGSAIRYRQITTATWGLFKKYFNLLFCQRDGLGGSEGRAGGEFNGSPNSSCLCLRSFPFAPLPRTPREASAAAALFIRSQGEWLETDQTGRRH